VATTEEKRLSFSAANHGQQEKAPAARPGLGWDLTDQTIMGAHFLANSAISENRCIFWTTLAFFGQPMGDLCFGIQ
jgi:hypothetical protein